MRSNKSEPPTSTNIAPATQNDAHDLSASASKVTLHTHQVLRLPRNSEFKIWARNPHIAPADIRRFEHDPRIKPSSRTLRFRDLTRPIFKKYNVSRSAYLPKFHEILRHLPGKVTLRHHQMLSLPRKGRCNITKCCACHEKCTLLFSTHLFSTQLFYESILYASILYASIFSASILLLFSEDLFSTPVFSRHLLSTISTPVFSTR